MIQINYLQNVTNTQTYQHLLKQIVLHSLISTSICDYIEMQML